MLSSGELIQFASGEVNISSLYRKKSTSFEYFATGQGQQYLIKCVPKPTVQLQELFSQEFTNQKLVPSDPHILALLDTATLQPDIGVLKFEYPEHGTLKRFMKSHELSEEQIAYIFKEILLAVLKINDNGIIHRDISPGNIWIGSAFCFKLSGFERSLRLDDGRQTNISINSQRLNHPDLRPPDITESLVLAKVDIWGLGCLLYYLIYRDYPFGDSQSEATVSQTLIEVLNLCLETNPDDRPLPRVILNMIISHKIPTLPFFFKSCNEKVTSLQYSGRHCMQMSLKPDPVPPDLFYLQQLTFTVWTQPEKINTLLLLIKQANFSYTLVSIKSLIVMHRLLLSGPKETLTRDLYSNLEAILKLWTEKTSTQGDEFYCEYFSGLIRQLARLLMEKVQLHISMKNSGNWKCVAKPSEFSQGVGYLAKVVRICEGLSMGMSILPGVNSFLAMQLVEECQRLIACFTPLDTKLELAQYTTRLSNISFQQDSPKPDNYKSQTVSKLLSPRAGAKNDLKYPEVRDDNNRRDLHSERKQEPVIQLMPVEPPSKKADPSNFSDLLSLESNFKPRPPSPMPPNVPVVQPSLNALQNLSISNPQIPNPQPPPLQPNLLNPLQNIPMNNPQSVNAPPPQIINSSRPQVFNYPTPLKMTPAAMNISEKIPPVVQNSSNTLASLRNLNSPVFVGANKPSQHRSSSCVGSHPVQEIERVQPKKPAPKPVNTFIIEKRWVLNPTDIALGPVLGNGASCTVYRGLYKRTPVAVKMMREGYAGQNIIQEFQREVSAMVTLRHPNLVLFMGACIEPQMMIISEFCAGESLFKLLHERKDIQLHWRQKLKMIIDIARGMLYLHEANPPILHRDLKSLNLLLLDQVNNQNDDILVKITDFGISRIIEEVEARMTVRMGTCHWMAPEVINSEPYSLAADVYSFGIVLWEIAARDTPYRGENPVQIPMKVLRGERPDLAAIGPAVPPAIKDLIVSCWDQSPNRRPNFRQIMQFLDGVQGANEF